MHMKRKTRSRRNAAAGTETGCKYEITWSPLKSTAGYVQVWVPQAQYDRAAKVLLRKTRERYARTLLRRRLAPLGVVHECKGTCAGWCGESAPHPVVPVFICECKYFA
jgi:hypothetical protein